MLSKDLDCLMFGTKGIFLHSEYLCIKLSVNNKNICVLNKVQVGKDQEKAQSEKDSHSKNQGGKKKTN